MLEDQVIPAFFHQSSMLTFLLAKDDLKAAFNASTLVDDGDFFYFLADSMAEGITLYSIFGNTNNR